MSNQIAGADEAWEHFTAYRSRLFRYLTALALGVSVVAPLLLTGLLAWISDMSWSSILSASLVFVLLGGNPGR